MKNYKFEPNVWITFSYGNKLYVGRTRLVMGNQTVSSVAEDGTIGEFPFSWVENPVKLNFGLTKKQSLQKMLENENTSDIIAPNKFPILVHFN